MSSNRPKDITVDECVCLDCEKTRSTQYLHWVMFSHIRYLKQTELLLLKQSPSNRWFLYTPIKWYLSCFVCLFIEKAICLNMRVLLFKFNAWQAFVTCLSNRDTIDFQGNLRIFYFQNFHSFNNWVAENSIGQRIKVSAHLIFET